MAQTITSIAATPFRHDVRKIGALSRAVGLLKGFVANSSTAPKPRTVQHVVLRRFMEIHEEASHSEPESETESSASMDPVRAAAVNRIRQLRIHAA
jgi:hypothetical protein